MRRKRDTNPTCPGDRPSYILSCNPIFVILHKEANLGCLGPTLPGDARGHKYFIKGRGSHSPTRSVGGESMLSLDA